MKKETEKYFLGAASKEEQHNLLTHLRASNANRQAFNAQKEAWKADEHKVVSLITWKAWQKVEPKLHSRKSARNIWLNTALSIASVIVVVFGFGLSLLVKNINQQFVTIQTRQGQNVEVFLPDSTKVHLNANSSLTYNAWLYSYKHDVELKGEAFFDVTKQSSGKFNVNVEEVNVQVLGTRFNVNAYKENKHVEVVLEEGIVELTLDNDSQFRKLLKPGDRAVINGAEKTVLLNQVNPMEFSSWKEGVFYFHDQKLEGFFERLEKRYGVQFVLDDDSHLQQLSINMTIRNDRLEDVLKIVELTLPVRMVTENECIKVELDKTRYELMKR